MVGLAGYNSNCIISECYSSSSVTGDRSAGGLVGGGGYISNCYATGSVTGARNIGGLVGYSSGIISNCYSTGSVTGTDEVGGLIGGDADTLIISSYWDIETSGQTISHGGRGKTTIQMKTASTFVGWGGYDNYGTWTIDDGDYPRLSWQGLPGTQLPDLELVDYLYGGSGQANDPYLISNAEELSLAGMFPWELDKHFKLIADINLIDYNENNFNIIGYYVYPVSYAFTGVFDGNGHTISNFTWRSESMADYSGLFGTINGAEIKDLRLIDPNVQATNETGALVGYSVNGEIFGCYIEGGTVSGGPAGGIIGVNHSGIISKCYSTCSVTGEAMIGGLAGTNKGTISNCYATGSVTGEDILGGLVGTVRSDSTISNCYATGSVTGEDDVGGLVGKLYYDSTISNCCATGSVTGDDDVGGLVGYLYYDGIISNCYATGSVTGNEDVGGLVGYDYGGFYAKCFWDSDVNPDVNGIGNTTDPNVTGESTANMQTMSTFTDAGWDFVGEVINGPNDIWRMCIDGVEYPKLWWEFTTGDFVCPDGVDFVDFAVLANTWLLEDGDAGYNSVCDISIPADETIDMLDLEVFSGNWLEGIQEP
jgi:hypothetical protein